VARRTGACAQGGDLPTGPYKTRLYPQGQRQPSPAGHLDPAGSGLHDSGDAGAGADLRGRPARAAIAAMVAITSKRAAKSGRRVSVVGL